MNGVFRRTGRGSRLRTGAWLGHRSRFPHQAPAGGPLVHSPAWRREWVGVGEGGILLSPPSPRRPSFNRRFYRVVNRGWVVSCQFQILTSGSLSFHSHVTFILLLPPPPSLHRHPHTRSCRHCAPVAPFIVEVGRCHGRAPQPPHSRPFLPLPPFLPLRRLSVRRDADGVPA